LSGPRCRSASLSAVAVPHRQHRCRAAASYCGVSSLTVFEFDVDVADDVAAEPVPLHRVGSPILGLRHPFIEVLDNYVDADVIAV
jgi:hypothetical protein